MLKELEAASNRVVGLKQLLRELEAENVARIYLAEDAEEHVKEKVRAAAENKDIEIVSAGSMESLGVLCGIDVGAACAALLKG